MYSPSRTSQTLVAWQALFDQAASKYNYSQIWCSPVNPITNVLPLVLVLAVSLAKEAFEDRKRAAKDKEVCLGRSRAEMPTRLASLINDRAYRAGRGRGCLAGTNPPEHHKSVH